MDTLVLEQANQIAILEAQRQASLTREQTQAADVAKEMGTLKQLVEDQDKVWGKGIGSSGSDLNVVKGTKMGFEP